MLNKIIVFITVILITLLCVSKDTLAQVEISVIVNSGSSVSLSQQDVKQIFNGQKFTWSNGQSIIIIDQGETETGKVLYAEFVKSHINKIRVEWTKKVLSGQMPAPIKCNNDEAAKKEVSNNTNAVAYILTKNLDKSVKEVIRIKL